MPEHLGSQALDESQVYCLTAYGSALMPGLAGHFTGSEVLTAVLWPGGDYAASATLSASWATTDAEGVALVGNPAGQDNPVLDLEISRSAISGLEPGRYCIKVVADAGTVDEPLWEGSIELTPAIGARALPRMYCTARELSGLVPWIATAEPGEPRRPGGFLTERDEASREAEEWAVARFLRDRRETLAAYGLDPHSATATLADGLTTGEAEDAFRELLADVGLVADARLSKIVANWAAHLALRTAIDGAPGEGDQEAQAEKRRRESMRLARSYTFRVDADPDDGVIDHRLVP